MAILDQYRDTLDELIDSSNLELSEMLHSNSQKQHDPMSNIEDEHVDIETNIEKILNILQQKKISIQI